MRGLVIAAAIFLASPLHAQEDDKLARGLDLMSEAARLLLEAMREQLDPALEGLSDWLENLEAYELPEVLPNGDIIIRKRQPVAAEEDGTDI